MNSLCASLRDDRHADAPEPDCYSAEEAEEIRARMDANAESITNWLCGACIDQHHVSSERIVRDPRRMSMRMEAASVAELFHLWWTDDESEIVMAARAELKRRHAFEEGPALFRATEMEMHS